MAGARKLLTMEKLKDAEFIWGFLRQKLNALQVPQRVSKFAPDFFPSLDIFSQLLRDIKHFLASVAAKFGEVLDLDPEMVEICLRWGLIVIASAIGVVVAFYAFCFFCTILLFLIRLACRGIYYLFLGLYYCCLYLLKALFYGFLLLIFGFSVCVRWTGVVMMRAPGTFGLVIIPRCLFLCSPRIYFLALRSIRWLLGYCAGNMYIVTCFGVGIVTMVLLKFAGVF